jgi:hypothetical protein
MPLDDFRIDVDDDFHLKGKFHRITVGTESWDLQQIALYPLSFSTLSMSELTEEPPMHPSPSLRCPKILVPRPSVVYASLIRLTSQYSPSDLMWINLLSEISQLIGYHLYELSGGFVDGNDDKLWEELEVDKRLEKAYFIVISWGCDGEWRKGEEWIGDVLAANTRGTANLRYLPHWPHPHRPSSSELRPSSDSQHVLPS